MYWNFAETKPLLNEQYLSYWQYNIFIHTRLDHEDTIYDRLRNISFTGKVGAIQCIATQRNSQNDELHLKMLSIRRGHKRLLLFHLSYEDLFFIVNFWTNLQFLFSYYICISFNFAFQFLHLCSVFTFQTETQNTM